MKTIYCIILCCFCLASCHSQTKNKEMKSDLNISLLFYPSTVIEDIRYSIDIINDSLIVKERDFDNKEYRGELTNDQSAKIRELISAVTQKHAPILNTIVRDIWVNDVWGCTLKIDNQVYYEDIFFSFTPRSNAGWQAPPEEIKLLIDYIVSLSPIPIELYGFA